MTWEKGRQLKSFDSNTYTYNANGIRTSKTVNGVKHTYTLDGTKILREAWEDNTLIPLYDNEDSVCGILYNNTPFYFLKNLQGDIISITNQNGSVLARYSYDAWGKCTITMDSSTCDIATINPFRYRGYYYDPEIGMYYLQSRYYNPEVARFLNGDNNEVLFSDVKSTNYNLYCYCYNDPVDNTDATGNAVAATVAKIVLGALFGLFVQLVADLVIFVARRLIEEKSASFNPSAGDYVGSALTWGLASVNPFGKNIRFFPNSGAMYRFVLSMLANGLVVIGLTFLILLPIS